MAASVLLGRILIIEPIGTVPARLYTAKGLVLIIWRRQFLATKYIPWSSFRNSPHPLAFLFLLTISRPPGGLSKQKNSFTPLSTSSLENRAEQAPISSPEARFISRPVHACMIPAVRYSKNADSAVLREKTIISPRNASASEWTLPRILKIKISRDTKPAILRELRKGKVRPYELQLARAIWKKGANNFSSRREGAVWGFVKP